jgi:O-antigen ligase
METATTRTSDYSPQAFASPLAILTGALVAASFALVSVLFGYAIGGILFGLTALALSMLSLEFGMALLFLIVILFNTDEIRSISIPFFGGGLRPTDLVTALIIVGWVFRMVMIRKELDRLPRILLWPVSGFVGLGIICAIRGIHNGAEYRDSLLELRPILSYLLVLPVVAEFRLPQIKRMVWLVILTSWVAALHSVFIYANGNGDAGGYTGGRMRVMEIEYPFVLLAFLIVFSMYIHRVWRGLAPVLCMISLLAGLAVTFYRSAFLAFAASLAVVYCLADPPSRRRWWRDAVRVAVIFLIAALADMLWVGPGNGFAAALGTRIGSIDDYENDVSTQHRLNEWNAALRLFGENPVAGAGLGTRVQFHSPMYSDDEKPREGYWSDDFYIHNAYVWLATKMGIVGLGIFLFLFGTALNTAITAARSSANPEERALLIGITGALVSLIVLSMFGPTVFTINQAPFAAFAFAIAHILRKRTPLQEHSSRPGTFALVGPGFSIPSC